MSVAEYERYRSTDIGWAGCVPSHWKTVRLRRLIEIRKRIANAEGPSVLSITQKGIKVRDTASNDGQLASSYAHYQIVEPGDFAMNHMDLLTGWVDISSLYGVTSPDYRVFAVRDEAPVDPRYLLAIIQLGYTGRTFYALGQGSSHLGRWRLPADAFNDFEVPLPPVEEQAAIAAFLDRETDKIDALMEAQRRLIELLKEKRQAVISHAVTKGLDPAVPMKDSGVEWLGQVPAHWGVTRVKYAASHVVDCLHTTPTYDGELEFPAIRTADVERGRLLLDSARLVSRDIYEERIQRLRPEPDDILYTREGERFGLAALVPSGVELCLGQRMMMIRIAPQYASAYVMWVLNSDPVYQQVVSGVTGATAPHVNISEVINFHLPIPPLDEQQAIANHILTSTAALDRLANEAAVAIRLLQERRAALISATVTGKIDVRGLDAPHQECDQTTARRLVGAAALELVADNPGSGRVKPMKLFYLAEVHAGVRELGGQYVRRAAGPYDDGLIREAELEMTRLGHIATTQPDGPGGQVIYRMTGQRGRYRDELNAMLGERSGVFDKVLKDVGALDKKGAEAVATLYAVWNDMLLDGQAPDDDAVILGFLNDWHPEKKEKFKAAELRVWLAWMRRHDLTPRGQGQRTTTGRLFV